MKIRSGFVSNSSSSSFIIIANPGKVKELLKQESKGLQSAAKNYLNRPENITLDGNKYELHQFVMCTEDFGCDCEEDSETVYDKWNDFTTKLGNNKDIVIRETSC